MSELSQMSERRDHWNTVYTTKRSDQCSWWQSVPTTSLLFLHGFELPKTAGIIDVGGGDSLLVDHLLDEGYQDITVLDISERALERAQLRLGERASRVTWICSDVLSFRPPRLYDLWHDRATFHFLTTSNEIDTYVVAASNAVNRYLMIGTFSDTGPERCSGLTVHRYSEEELQTAIHRGFEKIRCVTENHETPSHTTQNFLFCSFKKRAV